MPDRNVYSTERGSRSAGCLMVCPAQGAYPCGTEPDSALTCVLRVVPGVPQGEEFALRASSMSRFSWSSFIISWLIDSDQGELTCGEAGESEICKSPNHTSLWFRHFILHMIVFKYILLQGL